MPSFNYPNEKQRLYCNDCKKCGMIDTKSKKCITCNFQIPIFNYPNEKQILYCNDCKKCGMVDVSHEKCMSCTLTQANKKYNNHCAFCFINLFPNDQKSIKATCSKEFKNSNTYIK